MHREGFLDDHEALVAGIQELIVAWVEERHIVEIGMQV
jgi:hypothetical protein